MYKSKARNRAPYYMTRVGAGVLFLLLIASSVPAYVRNQVVGPDNTIWRAVINADQQLQIFANDQLMTNQPGGTALSEPALGRLGDEIYLVMRGPGDKVVCNRTNGGSWVGWVELGVTTSDAPAVASNGSAIYAAIRQANDTVSYGEITNCASGWVSTAQAMTASSPELTADHSGFYLYVAGPDGAPLRHKIGSGGWQRVFRFVRDTDTHGAQFDCHDGSQENVFGYGPHAHRVTRYGKLLPLCQPAPANACDVTPIAGLAIGGSISNALCYGAAPSNGSALINLRTGSFGLYVAYLWRSCSVGVWNAAFEDDGCDINVPPDAVPRLSAVSQIHLRGKATVHAAASQGRGTNALEFILWLYNPAANEVVEFVLLPYSHNTAVCEEGSGWWEHDSAGTPVARGYTATMACLGLPNVPIGGTMVYDANIRDFLVAKIADGFAGGHPDVSSRNPEDWLVANGPWIGNEQTDENSLNATVTNVVLELLY
jgi:hypothetical protein